MKELATAIMARYNASAGDTLRGLAASMFYGTAPQGTATPYIVFLFVGEGNDYTMPTTIHDITRCQFSIFDDDPSPSDCETIRDALTALYDFHHLTLATRTCYMAKRIGSRLLPEPDLDGWACHVEYEYRTAA